MGPARGIDSTCPRDYFRAPETCGTGQGSPQEGHDVAMLYNTNTLLLESSKVSVLDSEQQRCLLSAVFVCRHQAPGCSFAPRTLSLGCATRWTSGQSSFVSCSQGWTLITCRVQSLPAITICGSGRRSVPRCGKSKNTCLPLCPPLASQTHSVHHSYSISRRHSCIVVINRS